MSVTRLHLSSSMENFLVSVAAVVCLISFSISASADHECSDATHVFVETDCTGIDDCFTSMGALEAWIWDTDSSHTNRCSAPNAGDRLLVDIGPGTFTETGLNLLNHGFVCPLNSTNPNGYFTLRGSGADQTFLVGEGSFWGTMLRFFDCTNVTVQDMSITNDVGTAIYWNSGGTSQWSNLIVRGEKYGWYDGAGQTCVSPKGVHYWFNTQIIGRNRAFKSSCDENWIYSSDLVLAPEGTPLDGAAAVLVFDQGDVRLFGSTVRIDTSELSATTALNAYAVRVGMDNGNQAEGYGTVHMHGGIISLNATNLDDADLTAVQVHRGTGGTARAHIVDTAYAINEKTGGGGNAGAIKRTEILPSTASRSTLQSPFLWPSSTEPPLSDRVQSENGYDQYVEIDCQDNGLCDESSPSEEHPHLMIYDENCDTTPGNSPWYDTVTGRCRNDDGT